MYFCFSPEETDPQFWLAAEEYLLKNHQEEFFMIWQAQSAVVVGKHQNALAEMNYRYIRENGISVARRISGGGTVFHDPGNVNFSVIKNVGNPSEISFREITRPVVEALEEMGIDTGYSGRNDLTIHGKKFSGNAEHVFKNRVLHHGTLLFSSDLENLGNALKVVPGKYAGKAVVSNRSEVVNISDYLKPSYPVNEFKRALLSGLSNRLGDSQFFSFPETEKESIQKLAGEKFSTWDWQFGYSPTYSFTHSLKIGTSLLSIQMEIEKGIIRKIMISGDLYTKLQKLRLTDFLGNRQHRYESVEYAYRNSDVEYSADTIYSYF